MVILFNYDLAVDIRGYCNYIARMKSIDDNDQQARSEVYRIFGGGILVLLLVSGWLFYVGCSREVELPPQDCHVWTNAPADFSIGILTGSTPFDTINSLTNLTMPTLSGADVAGLAGWFVADPFLFHGKNRWYMFFEVCDKTKNKGMIGVAESQNGISNWKYDRIVLEQPYHLSFPFVFEWQGTQYMLPEGAHGGPLRLYKAKNFPYDWHECAVLTDQDVVDSVLFRRDDRWWLLCSSHDARTLRLFSSDKLTSGWQEHPKSPVVRSNRAIGRLGGRVFEYNGRIYRVAQDCLARYGDKIRVIEITKLTQDDYAEKEIGQDPLLQAGDVPWAQDGIHQFDVHPLDSSSNCWVAVIDGHGSVQPDHYLDAQFDNGARLGGVTLRPHKAVPGGTYMLRLYWDMPSGLTNAPQVFVHFVKDKEFHFQRDHMIQSGNHPSYTLSGWIPTNAPAGKYKIWCGIYDQASGDRAKIKSSFKTDDHATKLLLPVSLDIHR